MAEPTPGRNLLLGHRGLLGGQKPRPRLTCHGLSQAEVRTVAGVGVFVAGAARLATLNRAFGDRATTHGLGLRQFAGQLTDTRWDFSRSSHALIFRHI